MYRKHIKKYDKKIQDMTWISALKKKKKKKCTAKEEKLLI